VIDRLPRPELFKDGVGKPEHEDVLDRFLPEVMIDAIDLSLVGEPGQLAVEQTRRLQVMAEGFFDHEPLPARSLTIASQQLRGGQMLGHFRELAWRSGEITKQIVFQRLMPKAGQLLAQLHIGFRVGKIALAVKQVGGEGIPDRRVHPLGPRERFQRASQFRPPSLVALLPPGESNDAERVGKLFRGEQMVEGRDQLARRQVSAGSEDDNGGGLDVLLPEFQPARQQFIQLLVLIHDRR